MMEDKFESSFGSYMTKQFQPVVVLKRLNDQLSGELTECVGGASIISSESKQYKPICSPVVILPNPAPEATHISHRPKPCDPLLTNLIEKVKSSVKINLPSDRSVPPERINIFKQLQDAFTPTGNGGADDELSLAPDSSIDSDAESSESLSDSDMSDDGSVERDPSATPSDIDSNAGVDVTLAVERADAGEEPVQVKEEVSWEISGLRGGVVDAHVKTEEDNGAMLSETVPESERDVDDNMSNMPASDSPFHEGLPKNVIHITPIVEENSMQMDVEQQSSAEPSDSRVVPSVDNDLIPASSDHVPAENTGSIISQARKKLLQTIIAKVRAQNEADEPFDWNDNASTSNTRSVTSQGHSGHSDGGNPHAVFESSCPQQKTSAFTSDTLDKYLSECGQLERPLAAQTVHTSGVEDMSVDVDVIDRIAIQSFSSLDALLQHRDSSIVGRKRKQLASSHLVAPHTNDFFVPLQRQQIQHLGISLDVPLNVSSHDTSESPTPEQTRRSGDLITPELGSRKEKPRKGKIYGRRHGKFASKALLTKRKKPQMLSGRRSMLPKVISRSMAQKAVSALCMGSPLRCDLPGCRFGCICHLCGDATDEEDVASPASCLHVNTSHHPTISPISPSYRILSPAYDLSPPLPTPTGSPECQRVCCRLGCVCESISLETSGREKHCGRPECMLRPCDCQRVTRSSEASRQLWPSRKGKSMIEGVEKEVPPFLPETTSPDAGTRRSKRKTVKRDFRAMAALKPLWCYDQSEWGIGAKSRSAKHHPSYRAYTKSSKHQQTRSDPKQSAKHTQMTRPAQPNKHMKARSQRFKKMMASHAKHQTHWTKNHTTGECITVSADDSCARVRTHERKTKRWGERRPQPLDAGLPAEPSHQDELQHPVKVSKFKIQMVLLQKQGSDDAMPHLVEVLSNCKWKCIHSQMLNFMTELLQMDTYPACLIIRFEGFRIEVLQKTGASVVLPEHLQVNLGQDAALPSLRLLITPFTASDELMLVKRKHQRDVSHPLDYVKEKQVFAKSVKKSNFFDGDEIYHTQEKQGQAKENTSPTSTSTSFSGISGMCQLKVSAPGYTGGGIVTVPPSEETPRSSVPESTRPAPRKVKILLAKQQQSSKQHVIVFVPSAKQEASPERDTAVSTPSPPYSPNKRNVANTVEESIRLDHGCMSLDPATKPSSARFTKSPKYSVSYDTDDLDSSDASGKESEPTTTERCDNAAPVDLTALTPLCRAQPDPPHSLDGDVTRLTIAAAEDGKTVVSYQNNCEAITADVKQEPAVSSSWETAQGNSLLTAVTHDDVIDICSSSDEMKESDPALNDFSVLKCMLKSEPDVNIVDDEDVEQDGEFSQLTAAECLRYQLTGSTPSSQPLLATQPGSTLLSTAPCISQPKSPKSPKPAQDAPMKDRVKKPAAVLQEASKIHHSKKGHSSNMDENLQFFEETVDVDNQTPAFEDGPANKEVLQYAWETDSRPGWTQSLLKMSRERHRRHDIACRFKQLYQVACMSPQCNVQPVKHIILSMGLRTISKIKQEVTSLLKDQAYLLERHERLSDTLLKLTGHSSRKIRKRRETTLASVEHEFLQSTIPKGATSRLQCKYSLLPKSETIENDQQPAKKKIRSTPHVPAVVAKKYLMENCPREIMDYKRKAEETERIPTPDFTKSSGATSVQVTTEEVNKLKVLEATSQSGGKRVIKYVADDGLTYNIVIEKSEKRESSSSSEGEESSSDEEEVVVEK